MKKVFTLIVVLVLCMNYTKGQVRLTEVAPYDNYFELFYKGNISLDKYRLVIWTKNSGVQTIVVGSFKSTAIHSGNQSAVSDLTQGAVAYALNAGLKKENSNAGNSVVLPSTHSELWSTYFENIPFDKYTISNGVFTKTSTVASLFDGVGQNTKIGVFLINDTKASDFIVDEYTTQADINNIGTITFGSSSVNFSQLTLTSDKYVGAALGSGQSYQNTYLAATSSAPCQSKWTKGGIGFDGKSANFTPGFANGYTSNFITWTNSTYFISQQGDAVNLTLEGNNLTLSTVSGSIPKESASYSKEGSKFYLTTYSRVYNLSGATPAGLVFSLYYDNPTLGTINAYDLNDTQVPTFVFGGTQYTNESVTENTNYLTYPDLTGYYYKVKIPLEILSQSTVGTTTTYTFKNILLKIEASNSNCYSTTTLYRLAQVSALPVLLGELKVQTLGGENRLMWSTMSETNNKGFEIQRSIGNTNDFKTIGFVGTRAKDGNSQTEISYSFEDADVKAGQTHYYRLNQIDFDGKSAFSPVKSIKPGSIESNLNVYPNPSQGSFTVNTGSNSGKLNIFVMDNTGRVVNQFMNVSTSNTRINNLKKGFYTLKIVNTESGEQSAQRVVVQ